MKKPNYALAPLYSRRWPGCCLVFSIIFLFAVSASADDPASAEPDPDPLITEAEHGELGDLSRQLRAEARLLRSQASARVDNVAGAMRELSGRQTPGEIFRWIRDHIAYEPYVGSLRGPEGALVAGSANAVDQAVLAAAMLDEAGHSYRFVSGRLHHSDAQRVVVDALGAATLLSGREAAESEGQRRDFTDGVELTHRAVIASVEQHLWLEVNVDGVFRPFDLIAASVFGMSPAIAQERHAKLPSTFETTMQIALVSRLADGQTIEHFRLEDSLPRFAYRALSLSFEPDPTRVRGHRPVLHLGEERTDGESIPVAVLREMELQFRVRTGLRENRWSQSLYRRDQATDIFDFDHQHFGIAVIPGWTSAAQVSRLAAEAAESSLDAFDAWLEHVSSHAEDPVVERLRTNAILNDLSSALPFAFARVLDRRTRQIAEHFGVLPILGHPRVVTTGLLRRGDRFLFDLQLSGDRVEALPRKGVPAVSAPAFLGMHGQLRDQLVGELLSLYGGHEAPTVDGLFSAAVRQSIPFITIEGRTMSHLQRLQTEDWVRQMIGQMIRRRGMFILAPLKPVTDGEVDRFAWWALDPLSGELEAHTSSALLAVDDQAGEEKIMLAQLLRSHLGVVARHFAAATHAVSDDDRFARLGCSAARRLSSLGGAYCATSQPIAAPDIATCLDSPPQPGGDLLTMGSAECADHMASFRCATVYAASILNGTLRVQPQGSTPPVPPPPLCD